MPKWELVLAKNGMPTIRVINGERTVYLHSRYDPEKEAKRWVEHQISVYKERPERFLVIGMGAGYHIKALHRRFPDVVIDVWDFNREFGEWITTTGLLAWLGSEQSCITYRYTDSLKEFQPYLSEVVERRHIHFLIHSPSLELIPSSLSHWKQILEEQLLQRRAFFLQGEKLDENFRKNLSLRDPGISSWLGKYRDVPMILASAGPSLNKQIEILKDMIERKGKSFVLGCVGTALVPLLKRGVSPDFVMISDANISIMEQFRGVDTSERPLFYLSTANHETVKHYRGPRYIVWQEGYGPAEKEAQVRGESVVETGGSVATCLLDLMVKMGGNPIALIGQDLAYTDGWSHAADAHAQKRVNTGSVLYEVDDFYRKGKVKTSLNLLSYLRWFERYVYTYEKNVGGAINRFWNCTEGGAHIKGWKHAKLADFINEIG